MQGLTCSRTENSLMITPNSYNNNNKQLYENNIKKGSTARTIFMVKMVSFGSFIHVSVTPMSCPGGEQKARLVPGHPTDMHSACFLMSRFGPVGLKYDFCGSQAQFWLVGLRHNFRGSQAYNPTN